MKLQLQDPQILLAVREMIDELLNNQNINPQDIQILTKEDVKEYLKISDSTYKRLVKSGVIVPYRRLGGDRFYKHEFLQQLKSTKYEAKTENREK